MKTADQIEPRTIVNAVNTPGNGTSLFIISQPGSYYLTTNLVGVSGKNGIEILANNVTLDLNGFALLGVSGSVSGIDIPSAQTNVVVRNGTVNGWGYMGMYIESDSSLNMVSERLNVSACGDGGIFSVALAAVMRDCNCQQNGGDGITCINGIVSDCTANNNGSDGIVVTSATVSGCYTANNQYSGIFVQDLGGSGGKVIANTCIGNNKGNQLSAGGILIGNSNNRVEDNQVTANGYAGILVDKVGDSDCTKNIIIKNSVSGNGANNYVLPAGQIVGPIITNTVSGIITNSNPWANFSF